MSFVIRAKADRLRRVPLPLVLKAFAARQDQRDKVKWHTIRGVLSVNAQKFFNWTLDVGGGGAIDLTMHLGDCGFLQALAWLEDHFANHQCSSPVEPPPPCPLTLRLPEPDPLQLERVRTYLTDQRCIAGELIDRLVESGSLYADARANAVFVLFGTEARGTAAGAELRGSGPIPWRGMAPGSRKDAGYFAIRGDRAPTPGGERKIVLCESAIDAISCCMIIPGATCISTAGVRADPAWLGGLLAKHDSIHCGFDNDQAGDAMARAMILAHPRITRLRPTGHDWNDMLVSAAKDR